MSAVLELNPIPGADAAPAEKAKRKPKAVAPAPAPEPAADAPPAAMSIDQRIKAMIDSGESNAQQLTAMYLKLRNAKADLSDQAKAKISPLTLAMDHIESYFLAKFLEEGIDSIKTTSGTPYKSEVASVKVADNSVFLDHILTLSLAGLTKLSDQTRTAIKDAMLESGAFSFIEARAAKSAVEAHLESTQELLPGLERRVDTKVNVRAA